MAEDGARSCQVGGGFISVSKRSMDRLAMGHASELGRSYSDFQAHVPFRPELRILAV